MNSPTLRNAALCAAFSLLSIAAIAFGARAQQRAEIVVTVVSSDMAAIGTKAVPRKDIVSELSALQISGPTPMILIRNCKRVAPGDIQGIAKELQNKKFIVVLDSRPADASLCPS
jgi:hypothetical protein